MIQMIHFKLKISESKIKTNPQSMQFTNNITNNNKKVVT